MRAHTHTHTVKSFGAKEKVILLMKTFSFNLKSFLLSIHTTLRTRWDPKGHLNSFHRSRVLFYNSCRRSRIHPHFSTGNKELRSLGTGTYYSWTMLIIQNVFSHLKIKSFLRNSHHLSQSYYRMEESLFPPNKSFVHLKTVS